MTKVSVVDGLTISFSTSNHWESVDLLTSASQLFAGNPDWLVELVERVLVRFEERPDRKQLQRYLHCDGLLKQAIKAFNVHRVELTPLLGARTETNFLWSVPKVSSLGQLADLLELQRQELEWLAGLGRTGRNPRHYDYRWIRKRSSGWRLLESPRPLTKRTQRIILGEILSHIPIHDSSHGFVSGRNVRTFIEPHAGQPFCMKMDLKDFFPSIRYPRVCGLFRLAGYPKDVAHCLAALCTNTTHQSVIEEQTGVLSKLGRSPLSALYSPRHLPQGAPTSPCLANLVSWNFDSRLSGLAAWAGADYTRYADDLLFSGASKLRKAHRKFEIWVGAIALEEGLNVNFRKTRPMSQATRQTAAGVTFNERPNLPRDKFDQLKATLYNCGKLGPASQNREQHSNFRSHLLGKIAWVESLNPDKAARLRKLFGKIEWCDLNEN